MKLSIWCLAVTLMFLASDVTLGEIVPDVNVAGEDTYGWATLSGGPCGHDATAQTDAYDPYSFAYGAGHERYHTTVAGYFSWSYDIGAYASVSLSLRPPSSSIWVIGEGSAGSGAPDGGDGVAAQASLSKSGSYGGYNGWDDPPRCSNMGYDHFLAGGGVAAQHTAWAAGGIVPPTAGEGSATGSASGYSSMN